jgi:succinyl-CoA synthetase beta subunit
VDLFEYQERDMFEAHGVPVLARIVAHTSEEAKAAAEKIVPGMGIKAHTVKVMTTQGAGFTEECYFSVLLDRANRNYLALCSLRAVWKSISSRSSVPGALAKIATDPAVGIDQAKTYEIAVAARFAEELRGRADQGHRGSVGGAGLLRLQATGSSSRQQH